MKKQKYLVIALVMFLVLLFLFYIRGCFVSGFNLFISADLPKEAKEQKWFANYKQYRHLFTDEAISKLVSYYEHVSKSKYPFAGFTYDVNYTVIIHKAVLPKKISLDSFVVLQKDKKGVSPDIIYSGVESDNIHFYQTNEGDSIIQKVYITYSDSVKDIYTIGDSIASYSMLGKRFSINYESRNIKDIVIESKQLNLGGSKLLLNINIILYRKDRNLFFIFVYPRDKGAKVDSKFSLKLLSNKSRP